MPLLDTFKRIKRIPVGFIIGRLNGEKGKTGDAELIPIDDFLTVIGATLAASQVTYDNTTSGLTADDVQAAIDELAASVGSGTAADISFTPYDHIAATNVQAAIQEVSDEFVSRIKTAAQTMASALSINNTGLTILPASGVQGGISVNTEGVVGNNYFAANFRSDIFSPSLTIQKNRGTRASPTAVAFGDNVFAFGGQARYGTAGGNVAGVFNMAGRVIASSPSGTNMQSEYYLQLVPAGSITVDSASNATYRFNHTAGMQMFGANSVIDGSRHFRLRSYTTATLPSASAADQLASVSDDAVFGIVPMFSDGTNWRRVCDRQIVGAASRLLPAGGSAGQVLEKVDGTDYNVQWATPSGGGGITVSGAYFNGATGALSTASSSAFATKGIIFTPSSDMTITHIIGFVDGGSVGEAHHGIIAELSDATAAATVDSVLGTTNTINTATLNLRHYRYDFASPVTLTAGTPYLIGVVNASGGGTTVCRVGAFAGGATSGWCLNAPGDHPYIAMAYNTIDVTASQAASSATTDAAFNIALEGTTD